MQICIGLNDDENNNTGAIMDQGQDGVTSGLLPLFPGWRAKVVSAKKISLYAR